jgi:hypothetical protein
MSKWDLKIMLSAAISSNDITIRELINQKQMGAYTVPTRARGPYPDFLCTNYGPKKKTLRTIPGS